MRKRTISPSNPFGYTPKGIVWEFLQAHGNRGRHLDYGTHDGKALVGFKTTDVIGSGVGVDVNREAVERGRPAIPEGTELLAIKKGARLDFEDGSFDSVSLIGVLEHVHNQQGLLDELRRVLKPGGLLVVNVPGKHLFSFLDMGNFKFVAPGLHRVFYTLAYSEAQYRARYVECRNGLFGDVEKEKMWHEHFSLDALRALLERSGFEFVDWDGQGFFQRPLKNVAFFLPGFVRRGLDNLVDLDARLFSSCEIAIAARKGSA